jgi:glycosyltransferase involved in cell wall biosynthesis
MSNGCALASTNVGGVTDLMGSKLGTEDGFLVWEHGVTVLSRDIDGFSRALQFLIDNPSLRKEMGERGREFAHNRFSKKRLIADIENLYYKLAKDR